MQKKGKHKHNLKIEDSKDKKGRMKQVVRCNGCLIYIVHQDKNYGKE